MTWPISSTSLRQFYIFKKKRALTGPQPFPCATSSWQRQTRVVFGGEDRSLCVCFRVPRWEHGPRPMPKLHELTNKETFSEWAQTNRTRQQAHQEWGIRKKWRRKKKKLRRKPRPSFCLCNEGIFSYLVSLIIDREGNTFSFCINWDLGSVSVSIIPYLPLY